MLYFIGWCVFLLLVLLAVPIGSFLEKRAAGPSETPVEGLDGGEYADPDGEIAEAPVDDGEFGDEGFGNDSFGADPAAEFAADASGGDDFSAFDEEFK